jgi:PAS domain S-box-containing protein
MVQSTSLDVLLDHTQDKIVLLDDDGRFTYANAAVERKFGHDRAEIIGDDALEYIHPDDLEAVGDAFAETIAAESFTETTIEYRFRAADGSWVWLESRMSNLTDDALDGYVISSRDITDRVVAEREQRATAERLEELAAVTGDVLWMFTGDWSELLFVNPAYEEVYGRPPAELEADPSTFIEAVHPTDRDRVREAMDNLAAGVSVDLEYRVNPDRDYGVWVWVQAEPIRRDGDVVRISGFSRDVTDRRRRERQLAVMDNLLRHNLRNDLTTILGNANLIADKAPEVAPEVAVIRRTGDELLGSAEKQRDLIEILSSDATPVRLTLDSVIESAVATVRDQFPGATIEMDCPPSLQGRALVELELAITELLENGIRHSERTEPTIRIGVHADADTVVVTVADDAPEIPSIEARVLTGDYEMNDLYHSTGIGLWLVYWVAELSGGRLAVRSGDDGNRIDLEIPFAGE